MMVESLTDSVGLYAQDPLAVDQCLTDSVGLYAQDHLAVDQFMNKLVLLKVVVAVQKTSDSPKK